MNRFDDRLFIEFKMKDETGNFTDEEIIGQYDKEKMNEWMNNVDCKEALKKGIEKIKSEEN